MKKCPYCAESVQDAAVICPHCQKNIGPGHKLEEIGSKMQAIGCALTLIITVPVIVFMLFAGAC